MTAEQKQCRRCADTRPLAEFRRDARMRGGFSNVCGPCARRDHNAHYAATRARRAEYERTRYQANPARRNRAEPPEKRRARTAVKLALRSGRLTRQPCEACGHATTEAHHDDYARPLSVRWLCHTCHGLAHRRDALLVAEP